tara:strand:- start:660 stop:1544 length:885 start_codon:yes stop_codon:yes gene_type:complete
MNRLLLVVWCMASVCVASEPDLAGSEDPLSLERFPNSWIVEYEDDQALLAREFIVSRVDKTRRQVRAERKIRIEARQQSATYEIARGTPRQEVVDHYVALLGSGPLFSCSGRDCGRSNHWANHIFGQAVLYGPDLNQFYLAVERDDRLIGIYIIERGNRRVYAHVLVIHPEQPLQGGALGIAGGLDRNGYVVIDGVEPLANGSFSAAAQQRLAAIAPTLADFAGRDVYVVCHIYGATDLDRLLDAARQCGTSAADALAADPGPRLVPFAAGPMLPRSAERSRVELVLPPHLREE